MNMAMAIAAQTCRRISPKPHAPIRRPTYSAAQLSYSNNLLNCRKHQALCSAFRWIAVSQKERRGIQLRLKDGLTMRRRTICASTDGVEIMEGDVVEYPLPETVKRGGLYGDSGYGVGAVNELVLNNSSTLLCHVEPLIMDEPPQPTWIVDERQEMVVVPVTEVRRLQSWLSMRMIDDRVSNPHGEHAEHLWLIEESLSPDTGSPLYDETTLNRDRYSLLVRRVITCDYGLRWDDIVVFKELISDVGGEDPVRKSAVNC